MEWVIFFLSSEFIVYLHYLTIGKEEYSEYKEKTEDEDGQQECYYCSHSESNVNWVTEVEMFTCLLLCLLALLLGKN